MPVPRKPKVITGSTASPAFRATKCHFCGVRLLEPLRGSRRPCGVLQKCARCDFAVCAEHFADRGPKCPLCGGTVWVALDARALKARGVTRP